MSAETSGSDRDTEGQDADVLALMREIGPIVEERRHYGLNREDAEVYARTVLASDWLAAYVARKVEAIEQENRWNELACEGNQRLFAEALERAEKAERERDEARAVIERVTALVGEWEHGPAVGYDRNEQVELDTEKQHARTLRAALAPATEPASGRPLTIDEHLAEPRCGTCRDAGTVEWMVEVDPNCYQEPDSDGRIPCPDCASDRPLTVDQALAEVERIIEARLGVTSRTLRDVRAYREEVRRG